MSKRLRRDAWLVLYAWVEPDHRQPVRLRVRYGTGSPRTSVTRQFADAPTAAHYVAGWIASLEQWAGGEESPGESR